MAQESRKERRQRERKEAKLNHKKNVTACNEVVSESKLSGKSYFIPLVVLFLVSISAAFYVGTQKSKDIQNIQPLEATTKEIDNLEKLLIASDEEISDMDIGLMSLLCGEGLNGAENINIEKCLKELDLMAEIIGKETALGMKDFREDPSQYESSPELFKMAVMASLLQQDWGITYNDKLNELAKEIHEPTKEGLRPKLYQDAKNIFLQGCLTEYRAGTCVSLPVLYVAIGRRLGYPLSLALTKMHGYCRWDKEDGSHLNFEVTSKGISLHEDKDYKKFPMTMTKEDLDQGCYLRSLTNLETFGFLLNCRAGVLYACEKDHIQVFQTLASSYIHFDTYPDSQIMMSWSSVAPPLVKRFSDIEMQQKFKKMSNNFDRQKSNISRLREDIETIKRGGIPFNGTMTHKVDPFAPMQDPSKKRTLDQYEINPYILDSK